MKKIYPLLYLFCIACCFVQSCKKHGDGPDSVSPNIGETIFFNNAADPRFIEIPINSEGSITFFGIKDDFGKPVLITGYLFESSKDSNNSGIVSLNDDGRIREIVLNSGEGLNINETKDDSTIVTVFNKDSTVQSKTFKNLRNGRVGNQPNIIRNERISQILGKNDINIKVQAKDKRTGEISIEGTAKTMVFAEIKGKKPNYSIPASFDSNTNMFYVPYANTGIMFDEKNIVIETLSVLNKYMKQICGNAAPGDFKIFDQIKNEFCNPPTHPVVQLICAGSIFLSIGCKLSSINELIQNMNKGLAKIDPNFLKELDADVTILSIHNTFGRATVGPVKLNKLITDNILNTVSGSPLVVTHEFTSKLTSLPKYTFWKFNVKFTNYQSYNLYGEAQLVIRNEYGYLYINYYSDPNKPDGEPVIFNNPPETGPYDASAGTITFGNYSDGNTKYGFPMPWKVTSEKMSGSRIVGYNQDNFANPYEQKFEFTRKK